MYRAKQGDELVNNSIKDNAMNMDDTDLRALYALISRLQKKVDGHDRRIKGLLQEVEQLRIELRRITGI